MDYALSNFIVSGVRTTIPFCRALLNENDFISGKINTMWVENSFLNKFVKRHNESTPNGLIRRDD
jgi:biotin carboxylase